MTHLDAVAAPAPCADIWIAGVRVSNFRNIVEAEVALERGATFLVGENNAGKSSLLLAIATACGVHRATRDDLHRADDATASEATVDLIIRSTGIEFADVVAQRLSGHYGAGPEPGEWTAIRARLVASQESSFLRTRRNYLSWDASSGTWAETRVAPTQQVLELLAGQLVEASRDLSADVLSRSSDWGRVLADVGVSATDRQRLEASLTDLSGELQAASPTLGRLSEELLKLKDTQSGIEEVQLQPLPGRLEDLARSMDILVGSSQSTAPLPMHLQGLGSRSLAALRVFNALCELRVGVDQGVRPHVVTLLEEPEAHLHPQAQVAVHQFIRELPGQVVVATHSNVLIGEVDLQAVRILRASENGTQVYSLERSTAKKVAVFRRYISRPLGELFFSRLVVLVDGVAERITLPVLLRPLLGRDVAGLGVTVLDMQGQTREWVEKVIDGLYELGEIPWIAFVDNDSDGMNAIEGCTGTDGMPLSQDHDQVVMSGRKQLEQLLLDAGYAQEIQMVANNFAPWPPPDPRAGMPRLPAYTPGLETEYMDFLKRSKGWSGELIAREAMRNGRVVPSAVVELAQRIRVVLNLDVPATDEYTAAAGAV